MFVFEKRFVVDVLSFLFIVFLLMGLGSGKVDLAVAFGTLWSGCYQTHSVDLHPIVWRSGLCPWPWEGPGLA